MSVIIRLQNLPWSANSADIRQYFRGLSIPDGGVHIVGGEQGDAFIAFSSDEDARQAMMKTGGRLQNAMVTLLLSSRSEMQRVIEQARQRSMAAQGLLPPPATTIAPLPQPAAPAPAPVVQPPQPPAAAAAVVPSPDPEIIEIKPSEAKQKETSRGPSSSSRRRTRSRSRSRERRRTDRSRRGRSRSRSRDRDRRDRSRRDRSRSRDRGSSRRDDSRREPRSRGRGDRSSRSEEDSDAQKKGSGGLLADPAKSAAQPQPPAAPAVSAAVPAAPVSAPQINPWSTPQPATSVSQLQQELMRFQQGAPTDSSTQQPNLLQQSMLKGSAAPSETAPAPTNGLLEAPGGSRAGQPMNSPAQAGQPSLLRQGGYVPHNDRGGVQQPPDPHFQDSQRPPAFPASDTQHDGGAVQVRGMPIFASYRDVRDLFRGIHVSTNAIKMIHNEQGRRTGVAFVNFRSMRDRLSGLARSGSAVRGVNVSITPLEADEYERATDGPPTESSTAPITRRLAEVADRFRSEAAERSRAAEMAARDQHPGDKEEGGHDHEHRRSSLDDRAPPGGAWSSEWKADHGRPMPHEESEKGPAGGRQRLSRFEPAPRRGLLEHPGAVAAGEPMPRDREDAEPHPGRRGPLLGRDGPAHGGEEPPFGRDGPPYGRDGPSYGREGPPFSRDGLRGGLMTGHDSPMGHDGPMDRDGPVGRDSPMDRGGPMGRGGPMDRDGFMGRDAPMDRGGPKGRDGLLDRGGPKGRDGPMGRGGHIGRDGPVGRGSPMDRGGAPGRGGLLGPGGHVGRDGALDNDASFGRGGPAMNRNEQEMGMGRRPAPGQASPYGGREPGQDMYGGMGRRGPKEPQLDEYGYPIEEQNDYYGGDSMEHDASGAHDYGMNDGEYMGPDDGNYNDYMERGSLLGHPNSMGRDGPTQRDRPMGRNGPAGRDSLLGREGPMRRGGPMEGERSMGRDMPMHRKAPMGRDAGMGRHGAHDRENPMGHDMPMSREGLLDGPKGRGGLLSRPGGLLQDPVGHEGHLGRENPMLRMGAMGRGGPMGREEPPNARSLGKHEDDMGYEEEMGYNEEMDQENEMAGGPQFEDDHMGYDSPMGRFDPYMRGGRGRGGRGRGRFPGDAPPMEGPMGGPPGRPTGRRSNQASPFVRLENVSYFTTPEQMIELLADHPFVELFFETKRDDSTKRTGVAYALFTNTETAEDAIKQLTGTTVQQRDVRLMYSDKAQYDWARSALQRPPILPPRPVRPPPEAGPRPGGMRPPQGARHGPRDFPKEHGDVEADIPEREHMDAPQEEPKSSKESAPEKAVAPEAEAPSQPDEKATTSEPKKESDVVLNPEGYTCIYMEGLATTVTDSKVVDFFSDVGLLPLKLHVLLDEYQNPSGQAYCEFSNASEVVRALAKNEQYMGTSQVLVKAVPMSEVQQALGGSEETDEINDNGAEEAMQEQHMGRGGPVPRGGPRGRGRGRGFPGGRGPPPLMLGAPGMMHGPGGPEFEPGADDGVPVENFGDPGCVISVANIPYRASAQDILYFFGDFNVTPEQVLRRYDDLGRPTSDARIAFHSRHEAMIAMKTLNKQPMMNRPIYLTLV